MVYVHDIYFASIGEVAPGLTDAGGRFVSAAVVQTYRDVLGRDPHYEEGLVATDMLRKAPDLLPLRRSLVHSVEAQSRLAALYRALLGRDPTAAEASEHASSLAAGAGATDMIRQVSARRCALDDGGDVRAGRG